MLLKKPASTNNANDGMRVAQSDNGSAQYVEESTHLLEERKSRFHKNAFKMCTMSKVVIWK